MDAYDVYFKQWAHTVYKITYADGVDVNNYNTYFDYVKNFLDPSDIDMHMGWYNHYRRLMYDSDEL